MDYSSEGLRRLEDELIARNCAKRDAGDGLVMLPIRVPFTMQPKESN